MNTKHTKGEWYFREQVDANEFCILSKHEEEPPIWVAAFRLNGVQTLERQRANAKLMAAAPDLLEALVFCKSVIESSCMFERSEQLAVERAEQAIKKATE